MCSTFIPDCRYDISIIKRIGNLLTVRTKCVVGSFACTRRLFNISAEAIINVLEARPTVTWAIHPFKNKQNLFSRSVTKGFTFLEKQKSMQDVIGDVFYPGRYCSRQKCVYVMEKKDESCYENLQSKDCSHVLNIPFMDQKLTIILFSCDGTNCFAKQTSRDYENEKRSQFQENSSRITISYTTTGTTKQQKKSFHFRHNIVDSQLVDTVNQKFISTPILKTFSIQ